MRATTTPLLVLLTLAAPVAADDDERLDGKWVAESVSKVGVVFGDSADKITDFAATSAQSLGLARGEALATTGGQVLHNALACAVAARRRTAAAESGCRRPGRPARSSTSPGGSAWRWPSCS